MERVSPLVGLNGESLIAAETHELLQKAIVGNQDVDIAALINRLGNSDWVKQGIKYHTQDPEICPFCQQHTDENFAESLVSFFSDAYDNDIQILKTLQENYRRECEQLFFTIQSNVELNNPFLKTELFNADAQVLFERLKRNQVFLETKLAEPSRKIQLEPITLLLAQLLRLIIEANEETLGHNKRLW